MSNLLFLLNDSNIELTAKNTLIKNIDECNVLGCVIQVFAHFLLLFPFLQYFTINH